MPQAGIYEIRNTTNGKRYVGSSRVISRRLSEHRAMLRGRYHHSVALQRAWDKYGEESFEFRPLAYLEDADLVATEQRLIEQAFAEDAGCYNIARHSDANMRGRRHSEETRKRMSVSRTGNRSRTGYPSHWKGKKLSPAHCEAIKRVKQNVSIETRQKMSAAKIGKEPANKGIRNAQCKRGHLMTEENIYLRKDNGSHQCKACIRVRDIIRRESLKKSA